MKSCTGLAVRFKLARLDPSFAHGVSFGFETTLASRSFSPWIRARLDQGYRVHLLYLWLPDPEMALARVAERVANGGHAVADQVVQRRYGRGMRNFFQLYRPQVTTWRLYDNSQSFAPRLVASGSREATEVVDAQVWGAIVRQWA